MKEKEKMRLSQKLANQLPMNRQRKSLYTRAILSICLAWYLQALLRIWRDLAGLVNGCDIWYLFRYVTSPSWKLLGGIFAVLVCIQWICRNKEAQVLDGIYRHRLLLSAAAVALLVLFNISGSSIHILSSYTNTDANGLLLGVARSVRSDEWATSTPLAFSQAAAGFPYFSSVPRGGQTDMYITYGQAVKDYAVLFRPFYWGFLFLGASRGLSFFWWSRTFALLLVSFEFGRMLTKDQKKYAAAFSFMLTFSPFVQWWFAVVGMVEMLVFGMGAVLLFRAYLRTESYKQRLLLALAIAWCGCIYILTLYPAWMVPIAYIYLCFVIWIAYENRNCTLSLKKDGLIFVLAVFVLAGNLAYVVLKSSDTIAAVMNTVYPGKRRGGSSMPLSTLFYYVANLFTPLRDSIPGTNGSECSSFLSFFPLGIVLFLYQWIRQRKVDLLALLLTGISGLFALYTFADLPAAIDAVTLLQFSVPFRMVPILSLVQFILLFRVIANMDRAAEEWFALAVSLGIAVLSVWRADLCTPGYYSAAMLAVAAAVIFAICLGLMRMQGNRGVARLTALLLSGIVFLSGVLVNPVQYDTRELTDNQITNLAKPISEADPEALWIVEGLGYPVINLLIPVGIPTINSTNVYPILERWRLLDPTGEYEDIYNRYAHIVVTLTHSPTCFEAGVTPDQFVVRLNPDDLKTLGVGYIYTRRDLSEYGNDAVELILLDQMDADRIYKVICR